MVDMRLQARPARHAALASHRHHIIGRTRSSRKIILSGNGALGGAPLPWREGETPTTPGMALHPQDGPTGALFIDTM